MDRLEPRYGGGSLADLLPSVCDGLRVPGAWDLLELGESDRVVVLLIDGLGWHQLQQHREVAPVLAGATQRWITTVVPSTTATALTSLGAGVPAGQHGVVGTSFWLPDPGMVLWPLAWRQDVSPASVAPHPTWWQRAATAGVTVTAVSPRAYATSGLTSVTLGGARYPGADGPGERVAEVAAAIRSGTRSLVYAYWEALDRTAHIHGVASEHYRRELAVADRFVADVLSVLPAGARLIVTADHGIVDTAEDLDLDARPELHAGVRLVAGEPRLRHAYARPGAAGDVAAAWGEALSGHAEVLSRDAFVGSGLLGEVEPHIAERLGDVVALATGTTKLSLPSKDSIISSLVGQHGSLTAAEMAVPLLKWDC